MSLSPRETIVDIIRSYEGVADIILMSPLDPSVVSLMTRNVRRSGGCRSRGEVFRLSHRLADDTQSCVAVGCDWSGLQIPASDWTTLTIGPEVSRDGGTTVIIIVSL